MSSKIRKKEVERKELETDLKLQKDKTEFYKCLMKEWRHKSLELEKEIYRFKKGDE